MTARGAQPCLCKHSLGKPKSRREEGRDRQKKGHPSYKRTGCAASAMTGTKDAAICSM